MAVPRIQEFPELGVTSIVMDEADFNAFADELGEIIDVGTGKRADKAHIDAIKAAKHLPMMGRGTKTEKFFTRWNVTTERLTVIVRGQGKALFAMLQAHCGDQR